MSLHDAPSQPDLRHARRSGAAPALEAPALVNLALRGLMEAGIVAGLAYWGFHTAERAGVKLLLGLGAPLVGFGIWGAVDFRRAGRMAEPLRLAEELLISGLAAWAWYATGQHAIGWALAVISVVHHALVYALGARLMDDRP